MKLTHYSASGVKSESAVSDSLFGATVNSKLIAQAIRVYLANARQGTSKVKTRSEVNRTTHKVYKQKGTGNARHGSRNAPIFVGGGRAHGPTGIQNWSLNLSKKMKRVALVSALSAQAKKTVIHEGLTTLSGKTKAAAALINAITTDTKKILIIVAEYTPIINQSFRNIQHITVTTADLVTALDVSRAHTILISPEALAGLEVRIGTKKTEEIVAEVAPQAKRAPRAAKTTSETTTKTKPAVKKTTKTKTETDTKTNN